MYKILLLGSITLAAATQNITISYFQSSDCSGDAAVDHDMLGWTTIVIPQFQSFVLDRPMTVTEQIDLSVISANGTQCAQFSESFWNLSTLCQPAASPSTCLNYWYNSGPSADVLGVGWGWNSTTWVNTTQVWRKKRSLVHRTQL
jgi:hypothetical protein